MEPEDRSIVEKANENEAKETLVEEDIADSDESQSLKSVAFIEFREAGGQLNHIEVVALENNTDYNFEIEDASGRRRNLRVNNIDSDEIPVSFSQRYYENADRLDLSYNQNPSLNTLCELFDNIIKENNQFNEASGVGSTESAAGAESAVSAVSVGLQSQCASGQNEADNAFHYGVSGRYGYVIANGGNSDGSRQSSNNDHSQDAYGRANEWSQFRESLRNNGGNDNRHLSRYNANACLRVNGRNIQTGSIQLPHINLTGSITTIVTRNKYILRRKSMEMEGNPSFSVNLQGWRDRAAFYNSIFGRLPQPRSLQPSSLLSPVGFEDSDEPGGETRQPYITSGVRIPPSFFPRNPLDIETSFRGIRGRQVKTNKCPVPDSLRLDGIGHIAENGLSGRQCSLPECLFMSRTFCGKCNIALCTAKENRNCFSVFHTREKIKPVDINTAVMQAPELYSDLAAASTSSAAAAAVTAAAESAAEPTTESVIATSITTTNTSPTSDTTDPIVFTATASLTTETTTTAAVASASQGYQQRSNYYQEPGFDLDFLKEFLLGDNADIPPEAPPKPKPKKKKNKKKAPTPAQEELLAAEQPTEAPTKANEQKAGKAAKKKSTSSSSSNSNQSSPTSKDVESLDASTTISTSSLSLDAEVQDLTNEAPQQPQPQSQPQEE